MPTKIDSIWNAYSKFLLRFPCWILIGTILIAVALIFSLTSMMKIRPFDQIDFFLPRGAAMQNAQRIEKIYGSDKNFRVHQQMDLYPALDVIIKRKVSTNETNLLSEEIIEELQQLDRHIQSIEVASSWNYSRLCAVVNRACMVDGNYLLSKKFQSEVKRLRYIPSGIYIDSTDGANGIDAFIFGKDFRRLNVTEPVEDYDEDEDEDEEEEEEKTIPVPPVVETISYVRVFRLRYALNISTETLRQLSLEWERKVLRSLNEDFQSDLIEVSASTSTAISDLVSQQARNEGIFLAIFFAIFFIVLCAFLSFQGNAHTSVGYLSFCGIINFILATGSTFGLMTLAKIDLIEPMALIVFIVAIVDCLRSSILCGIYHRIVKNYFPSNSSSEVIEEIYLKINKCSRSYFFSSTLILVVTYVVLAVFTPIPCTRMLCLTLAFYLFIAYLFHNTFYCSCLVLTLKRLQSHRHCLTCLTLPKDYYVQIPQSNSTSSRKKFFEKNFPCLTSFDRLWKRFFSGFICLFSLISLIFSLWLILSIDTRLFDDRFLPRNATALRSYMKSQSDDYNIGPVIMFVIPQPINYENRLNRQRIEHLVDQCRNETNTNNFKLVWTEHENLASILDGKESIEMRITPYSQNDLVLRPNRNRTSIVASRFYCQYRSIRGDREDLRTMNQMYTYANQSGLTAIFPYSLVFPHYESLGQIRLEIYLLILLISVIAFLVVLLVFFSFRRAFLVFTHVLALQSVSLACLYVFHDLSWNFANALWFYFLPIIYLDSLVHYPSKSNLSSWIWNRVIFSLLISLLIFSFFPIESYLYEILYQSLFYQSIVSLVILNISFPSWFNVAAITRKKQTNLSIIETNQPFTMTRDIENLVN